MPSCLGTWTLKVSRCSSSGVGGLRVVLLRACLYKAIIGSLACLARSCGFLRDPFMSCVHLSCTRSCVFGLCSLKSPSTYLNCTSQNHILAILLTNSCIKTVARAGQIYSGSGPNSACSHCGPSRGFWVIPDTTAQTFLNEVPTVI